VFWTRSRREARRQQVLDELLAMDPNDRRGRLDVAVVAGDVRKDEVESALRLVGRLDALRVMTVPPSGRLPGGIVPIGEGLLARHAALEAEKASAAEGAGAAESDDEAEAVAADSDSTGTPGRSARGRAAFGTRSGRRSSRRRRRARVASQDPATTEVSGVPKAAENWPSIEWLRP
jgi:hypothetical protein